MEDGKFVVKGKLIDPKKPGKLMIRIDPPTDWIVGGLEDFLRIYTAPADAVWG